MMRVGITGGRGMMDESDLARVCLAASCDHKQITDAASIEAWVKHQTQNGNMRRSEVRAALAIMSAICRTHEARHNTADAIARYLGDPFGTLEYTREG
jgi:hypothetical protein